MSRDDQPEPTRTSSPARPIRASNPPSSATRRPNGPFSTGCARPPPPCLADRRSRRASARRRSPIASRALSSTSRGEPTARSGTSDRRSGRLPRCAPGRGAIASRPLACCGAARDATAKALRPTIPVDDVRRALALFGSTAADGGYRICIVDSADDLTMRAPTRSSR